MVDLSGLMVLTALRACHCVLLLMSFIHHTAAPSLFNVKMKNAEYTMHKSDLYSILFTLGTWYNFRNLFNSSCTVYAEFKCIATKLNCLYVFLWMLSMSTHRYWIDIRYKNNNRTWASLLRFCELLPLFIIWQNIKVIAAFGIDFDHCRIQISCEAQL